MNTGSGKILVIDSATYKIIKSINIASSALEFNPKNGYIYAVDWSRVIYVIDGATKEVIRSISFNSLSSASLALDSKGNIYVGGRDSYYNRGSISVINGTTNEVINWSMSFDSNVDALAFDYNRGNLYAADMQSNMINVIHVSIGSPYTIKSIQ